MEVQVVNISNNSLPKYETPGSAGMDIRADLSRTDAQHPIKLYGKGDFKVMNTTKMVCLEPGSRAIIPTGIFTAIPEGYEVQLRPRSGLAIKKGLTLINSIGTIDAK
jgi:dUTP pyrophosphatase